MPTTEQVAEMLVAARKKYSYKTIEELCEILNYGEEYQDPNYDLLSVFKLASSETIRQILEENEDGSVTVNRADESQ